MDRRRESRITTALPVMVRGLDAHGRPFEQVAHTVDISPTGARLKGIGYLTRPGRPINLEYKGQIYGFHAVWVGAAKSPRFGQVGISLSEPSWRFWKETLHGYFPHSEAAAGERAAPQFSGGAPFGFEDDGEVEKRRFSRIDCDIPARVGATGCGSWRTGLVTSISLNGCFIETRDPAPLGSVVEMSLEVGGGTQSRGMVRRSVPALGMGIEFTEMTAANFRKVQTFARDSVPLHGSADSGEVFAETAPQHDSTAFGAADVVDTVVRVLCQKGFSVAMKRKG
jgi:PilZ domain